MIDGFRLGRDGSRLTVLYDRDCGICGLTARSLRRWGRNGRFELVALQEAATSRDPRLVGVAAVYALEDQLHVVDEAGHVAAGGDAALAIVDALPGGWLLGPLAAFAPLRRLVSLAYGWVAGHRLRVGCWLGVELSCEVPSGSSIGLG